MRPLLEKIASLQGHKQGVYALAAGPDGRFFTSGTDGQVAEWSVHNPGEALGLARLTGSCYALAFVPPSHHYSEGLLVVAQNQEGLHFIDVATRQKTGSLALGPYPIYGLLAMASRLVAVADGAGIVSVIDPIGRQVVAKRQVSAQSLRAVVQLDATTLATGGSDGQVRLLDTATLQEKAAWPAHSPTVFTLCGLPSALSHGLLATGGRDARLRLWDLNASTLPQQVPKLLYDVPAHLYSIYDIALHPGGELLLTASMDKTLKLWDATTLNLLRVQDHARHGGHTASVNRCLWLDANHALSCSDDRTAILWRLGEG
jgi:WD40 repeat protein